MAGREDYPIGEINEYASREGATALADRIRHYWHMRGQVVKTDIFWFHLQSTRESGEEDGRKVGGKSGFWCVRSDMVGGFPAKQGRNLREVR